MQTKSPKKSSEKAFGIVQLFYVIQKLLKLNLPSKTIHQWLLDEIVSERWVLPSWWWAETLGSYHSSFSFYNSLSQLVNKSINQNPLDFTQIAHSLERNP